MDQEDKITYDDPYVNSSSNPGYGGTNPLEFFNFEQHNSVSHNSDLFWKPSSPSSLSKPIVDPAARAATGDFCRFDGSSLQRCVVIPCEPNERPSQGLSLSLSSTNPSTIGIQPFELVRPSQDHHHHPQGHFGKPMSMHGQQDMIMTEDEDGFSRKLRNIINTASGGAQHQISAQYNIRSSRYLVPAQDLLNEFCNLGTKQSDDHPSKIKTQDNDNSNHINSTSSKNKSLNTLDFLELQKRKSRLLRLLEEVDRSYNHYCAQMKAVVSSFESVAGNGAATVYSALASKAMSRHFRCLRDGVVSQIKATKKVMGENDVSAPGATRGETPRLRLLDQTLRQQRAFQQMNMMDSHPWRPQRGLPERSVSVLRAWLFEHFLHPYPSDVDKHILSRQTGLSRSQVSNWFINARVRLWKPMVEEMYMEETKENDHEGISERFNAAIDENTAIPQTEQKPTVDRLFMRDSECLSSIINHHDVHHTRKTLGHDFHHSLARLSDSFDVVDQLEFSTYNHNFGGGGGGMTLTLGLQQHGGGGNDGGNGVALFYPKDHMEDCQNALQYASLLEGDQGQHLPYRNLMGAHLLHDLAG